MKISVKSPVPNIVSFPPDITIKAGQSSAIFDVTTTRELTLSVREILILASYGSGGALAAKLTVSTVP